MENSLKEKFGFIFESKLLEEILNVGKLRTYKQNDIIIDINQQLNYIPLLLEGNIKVLREDDKGDELLLYTLEGGDTCAMSLTCTTTKKKSKIRAIAEKDVSVIMISANKIREWLNDYESWRNFILESYQIRFDEMLATIDALAFMNMNERLYKYLIDHVKLSASPVLQKTHQQIAEDLHTSRVVISRLLKQLENEQKIKLRRTKIEVLKF